jgi:hypothetical protein
LGGTDYLVRINIGDWLWWLGHSLTDHTCAQDRTRVACSIWVANGRTQIPNSTTDTQQESIWSLIKQSASQRKIRFDPWLFSHMKGDREGQGHWWGTEFLFNQGLLIMDNHSSCSNMNTNKNSVHQGSNVKMCQPGDSNKGPLQNRRNQRESTTTTRPCNHCKTAYWPGINQVLINILDLDFLQPTCNTDKNFFALHFNFLLTNNTGTSK